MRYAILAAVSTKEQAASDRTSLPNQINDARAAGQAKGWSETAGPFEVPGHSRTRYINLRDAENAIPALRALLDSASRGEYDVLIMQDHDRLRSILRAVYYSLCDYGVQLYSLAQQVEPVPPDQYDPYANDSAEIYIGVSEIKSASENSRMRRKYRSGMRDRVRVHGLPVQVPYGYSYPPRLKRDDKPVPAPDPELVPHLVQLKNLLLQGKSIRQLIDYLNENELIPPRSHIWHPQTVRDILKNPFYAGQVRFEVSKTVKDRRRNRVSRDRSHPENAITAPGQHQTLWTLDEHKQIVAEFRRRAKNYRGRQNNQFTGLLHCGECGAPLWRYQNGPRGAPSRLIWRCSVDRTQHAAIPHHDLLDKVAVQLLNSLRPYLENRIIPPRQKLPAEIIPPSIENLRAQLARLEDAYRKGRYTPEHYDKDWLALNTQIREIEDRESIEDAQRLVRKNQLESLTRTLGPDLHQLPTWLSHNDPAETNRVLHLLLEKIVVTPIHNDHVVELYYR